MEANMSRRDVSVVEEFLAALKRRDMPAALALLDGDVEWVAPRSLPYGGAFHGPREVAEGYFRGFLEHVDDDFDLIVDELIDTGDRVVGRLRLRGHGRLSGQPFEVPAVDVLTVRAGRVSRLEYHIDTASMLRALELPAAT
jgi:ketosteroid isomerase-like protein